MPESFTLTLSTRLPEGEEIPAAPAEKAAASRAEAIKFRFMYRPWNMVYIMRRFTGGSRPPPPKAKLRQPFMDRYSSAKLIIYRGLPTMAVQRFHENPNVPHQFRLPHQNNFIILQRDSRQASSKRGSEA